MNRSDLGTCSILSLAFCRTQLKLTSWCVTSKSQLEMTSTFRFGTTCGPNKTAAAAAAEKAQTVEEADDKGNCDPDKLLQCPYDKNHQIRACRFPYHLIKCRKNHPKLASELKTCPFNARHLVPKHELNRHTETCEDRKYVDTEDGGSINGFCKWQLPVSTWENQNMTEDWDKEVDDNAAPFVWGQTVAMKEIPESRPTNNLGPSFRTPNTLPWPQM